jgi:hypothetical protein
METNDGQQQQPAESWLRFGGRRQTWKFACDSGARVPGEKRSFANHHGLEPETGRKGRRAFPTRSEASHKLISHPRRLAARAVNRREGISPTAMRWGIVEHFALG